MAFQKNQILTLSIESLSNDGSGVAHHDGHGCLKYDRTFR